MISGRSSSAGCVWRASSAVPNPPKDFLLELSGRVWLFDASSSRIVAAPEIGDHHAKVCAGSRSRPSPYGVCFRYSPSGSRRAGCKPSRRQEKPGALRWIPLPPHLRANPRELRHHRRLFAIWRLRAGRRASFLGRLHGLGSIHGGAAIHGLGSIRGMVKGASLRNVLRDLERFILSQSLKLLLRIS